MLFSDEGNALIKNLHQYKKYGSWRLLTEIVQINGISEHLAVYLKRFGKQKAPTEGTGERPTTNTSFNTSGIQRDRSNTIQCRMDHLLRSWSELSEVSEKSLCVRSHELTAAIVSFRLLTLTFHKVV